MDEGFESYEPVLWKALSRLAAGGFVAAPDEARDLILDFRIEAWQGLQHRYDPGHGVAFGAYLFQAFYQFARRRLARLRAWRARLADIRSLDRLAGAALEPGEVLAHEEELRRVRAAITRLPRFQREVLQGFLVSNRPSERELARSHGVSRYRLREALIEALGRVAMVLGSDVLASDTPDGRVALALWDDGLSIRDAAGRLGLSIPEVQAARLRNFQRLLANFHGGPAPRADSETGPFNREVSVMTQDVLELLRRCLLTPNDGDLLKLVQAEAPAIAQALEEADPVFSDEEVAGIEAAPEWVSLVYAALADGGPVSLEEQEVQQVLEQFCDNDDWIIAQAFSELLDSLPPSFHRWEHWFAKVPVAPPDMRMHLERQPEVAYAGVNAMHLTRYGLTPAVIIEAVRGVELLAERLFRQAIGPRGRWPKSGALIKLLGALREATAGDPPFFVLSPSMEPREEFGDTVVPYGLLIAQLSGTPGCPPEAVEPLLCWMVAVARRKPWFFAGYEAEEASDDAVRLVRRPWASRDPGLEDLRDRWTRDSTSGASGFSRCGPLNRYTG